MNSQSPHLQSLYTTRMNKISSTMSASDPINFQQTESTTSNRPSHRKYKISHSQISKIDKLSREGLLRWKERRQSQVEIKNHQRLKSKKSDQQNEQKMHELVVANTNITQADQIPSIHQINYQLKKEKLINLQANLTLHMQIITFDLRQEKKKDQPTDLKPKQNQQNLDTIEVICFQVHDKKSNIHYRSQFTYKTIGKDVKFVFDNVQQLFCYILDQMKNQKNHKQKEKEKEKNDNQLISFDRKSMQLHLDIKFQHKSYHSTNKTKKKTLKIPLLPYAMIEIVENHHLQEQERNQLEQQIKQLKNDLNISRDLIHALREENDKLKERLKKEKYQVEKQKNQKEMLLGSYEKLSKTSQVTKEFYFEFVPDPKAKNFTNFTFKNNLLKKVKNDLKWDQVSSEAPLPKAGRHYFSFLIKEFLPDFMLGIVTLKGKDTSNAFLGLQTVCLYASKNHCHIYDRGKHYKISVNVKRYDVIFVIVDRQKGVIEWVKKKSREKSKQKDQQIQRQQHSKHQTTMRDLASMTQRHLSSTRDDFPLHYHNTRHRKSSQTISSSQLLNQLSAVSILPLNTYFPTQQIQYIHSVKIPEQMLAKQLYAYLEVYNINDPLKLNQRK